MELIIKAAAAGLSASILALLLKKSNPELALLLGLTATALIAGGALGFLSPLRELALSVKRMTKGSEVLLSPVFKCLGIALITKLSSQLCRDSSQAAAASALEFAGTVCAMSTAMPLIVSVLNMIGGLT